ncbi:hypothetical protein PHLGIDRAFT_129844 [Phlebiopsis gigantea 11061_1 CR5-6]|uniref:NFX1-type zinc finger-containing protein 1 n=1 Tax=Phlebiopsis gigantea (strain 11061_1 CR5-6) TaxID=745531 RepID=A0A0C3S2P6_PHLG1|nr:hypothetical protein PHLGIDRAFT_129844 [Phlebiopsis gigantea 11061_1 CR5-6]
MLSPAQAMSKLEGRFTDTLRTGAQVCDFVQVIRSVHARNRSWKSENVQSLMQALVKGGKALRVRDILRYKSVTHDISRQQDPDNISFQGEYFPALQFLASDIILKSTVQKNINHLYTLLKENYNRVDEVITTSVADLIATKSFNDPSTSSRMLSGVELFQAIPIVLSQLIARFKDTERHPKILNLATALAGWFEEWAKDVTSARPSFRDKITTIELNSRRHIVDHLREDVQRLVAILRRQTEQQNKSRQPRPSLSAAHRSEALASRLLQTYDPPGELRLAGPRHDNDHQSIADIKVIPTLGELRSSHTPYLPPSIAEAPHHLPAWSMERLLDIQFRLLREEMVTPLRASIAAVLADIKAMEPTNADPASNKTTHLGHLFRTRGGVYNTTGIDSTFFHIYTRASFCSVSADRGEVAVGLLLDAPPGGAARAPSSRERFNYWQQTKLLTGGTLVVLVVVDGGTPSLYLGVVSTKTDVARSALANASKIRVEVAFFDVQVELLAIRRRQLTSDTGYAFLVDCGIMYEASRPFLERLQTVEPEDVPFQRYLLARESLQGVEVPPPKYAATPGFKFRLNGLRQTTSKKMIHSLDVTRSGAVARARQELLKGSSLDPSQVDAVVSALTSEVALIQGPPGTGKSYTGRELLRVLIESNVRPIVLIAYTNHALDHMLSDVLDAGITRSMVRLGSQSSDNRISEFTLEKIEKSLNETAVWKKVIGGQFQEMKEIEGELKAIVRMTCSRPTWPQVQEYLRSHHRQQYLVLSKPTPWIQSVVKRLEQDESENGEWISTTGKIGKPRKRSGPRTPYDIWKEGLDLDFIASAKSRPDKDTFVADMLGALGVASIIPPLPTSNRPLDRLRSVSDVWAMSQTERNVLATYWEQEIRSLGVGSYTSYRKRYKAACRDFNEIKDEKRRSILSRVKLIGCTTTGAAKLTSILSSIRPKVVMVEEGGQVLEAHVLSSLVKSVQHLIFVGDPEQLRPNITNFSISMNSSRGQQLYKFDRSLMERLADESLAMTQINVQRRMRPEISHLIRKILYPALSDHALVRGYPSVQGMQTDVFFFDHTNAENSSQESVSKSNMFEVGMIKDLVMYFLRQGAYNEPGDIAVLCAYLGQLQKVKQALAELKVTVALDERDEAQLALQGADAHEDSTGTMDVSASRRVDLGTVDIFQGREAKIVIVSLVRNDGTLDSESASIGFLKSSNRVNVALSRAKHGLYILGNAANLRKNQTWSTILDEMESRGQIGEGFPVFCPRHPKTAHVVTQPGELEKLAPAGGCQLMCRQTMPCGHICPSHCHDTRDNHRSIKCEKNCEIVSCPRQHPCTRMCWESCGNCTHAYFGRRLPCGHVSSEVPCYLLDRLQDVYCPTPIDKTLSNCGHLASVPCGQDPAWVHCERCEDEQARQLKNLMPFRR